MRRAKNTGKAPTKALAKPNQKSRKQRLPRVDRVLMDIAPDGSMKVYPEYPLDPSIPGLDMGKMLRRIVPRSPGRTTDPKIFEILDAAAKAYAETYAKTGTGKYRHVAHRYKIKGKRVTEKQLTDWRRIHGPYFDQKVKEFKDQKAKELTIVNKPS
jgi:hypothetical protein